MLTAYHKILGVDENASLNDIKSAYRSLAKKFHPDINKSEGAEAVFIRINEAYEYLTHEHEYKGRIHSKAYYDYKEKIYKDWIRKHQDAARKRASGYANMNYRRYKKSILEDSPLTFYGIKLAGCLTTLVVLLIIIFIVAAINPTWAIGLAIFIVPAGALIMTLGEDYIKMDEVLKWFK